MSVFTAITSLLGGSCSPDKTRVGEPAPIVSAINQDGASIHFADVYAKGPTVVFFYPKANTPGCTAQACSLRDAYTDLTKEGVQVLGVSLDTPAAQKKFKADRSLPYDLIADQDGKVAEAFKVGKVMGLLPMTRRQCFLIKDGKIAWHDESASTSAQAEDVKKALKSLL